MRWFFALVRTARPALAKAGSTSPATLESSAENATGDCTTFGSHGSTVSCATRVGMGSSPIHFVASAYDFPAERPDAATSASSNHG
jgi:hypothetical protein